MTNTDQLKKIMISQLGIFEELLSLEKHKSEVLVAGEIAQLDKLVHSEQAYVMHLTNLEMKMAEIIAKYFPEGYSISQITAYCVKEDKTEFQNLQEQLALTVNRIQKLNKMNQELLKSRLDMVNFIAERIGKGNIQSRASIDIFADANAKGTTTQDKASILNKRI